MDEAATSESTLNEWIRNAISLEVSSRTGSSGLTNAFVDFGGRLVSPLDVATVHSAPCAGDRILARIQAMLKRLDGNKMFPRSQIQKELHALYTNAEMEHIYGPEYDIKASTLKMKMKVADFHPRIGVSMPRRFGKTQSVGQHNATMLACMEAPFIISVFSPGARASKMLLRLTYAVLVKLAPEADLEVKTNNAETLALENPVTKNERTMNSYPGGVR